MEPEPVQNYSTNPAPVDNEKILTIKGSKKPQRVVRLLTASEAFETFPGLYYKRLYHLVEAGHVEALHRHDGRTYYSEAQLRAAFIKQPYMPGITPQFETEVALVA